MPVKGKSIARGIQTEKGISLGSTTKSPKPIKIRRISLEAADNGVTSRTEYEYDKKTNDGSTYGPDSTRVHEGVTLDDVQNSLGKKLKNIDGDQTLDPKEKRVAKAKAYMSHGQDRS